MNNKNISKEEIIDNIASTIHNKTWSMAIDKIFQVSKFNEETGEIIIPKYLVNKFLEQLQTDYYELAPYDKCSDKLHAEYIIEGLENNGYKIVKVEDF